MLTQRDNGVFLETLISIFTIDDSKVKILLIRRDKEPYKGYWELPHDYLKNNETLENNITDVVYDQAGLSNLSIEQCDVYGALDRDNDQRVIGVSYMGIVDVISSSVQSVENDLEIGWFELDNLPKLAYDHEEIIEKTYLELKSRLRYKNTLCKFYPSDFTLPEIQKTIECICDESNIDRRNFRKKFMKLNLIEDTGLKTGGKAGRPAKLYKFKETEEDAEIF